MFKILVLALALMFVAPFVVKADSVWDNVGDALTGKNEYIETWGYAAVTIELEKIPYINILNADLRIKGSTPIGDDSFRKGIVEVGLEWEL